MEPHFGLSVCQIEHRLITKDDLIISLVLLKLAVGQAVPLVIVRENLVLLCNPLFLKLSSSKYFDTVVLHKPTLWASYWMVVVLLCVVTVCVIYSDISCYFINVPFLSENCL